MLGWRGGGWRESREDLGRRAPEVANDRASKNQAPYLEILLIARIALIWDWLFGLRQCWLLGSWVTPFRHDSCLVGYYLPKNPGVRSSLLAANNPH